MSTRRVSRLLCRVCVSLCLLIVVVIVQAAENKPLVSRGKQLEKEQAAAKEEEGEAKAAQIAIVADPQASFQPFAKKLFDSLVATPARPEDSDGGYGMARNLRIQVQGETFQFRMSKLTKDYDAIYPIGVLNFQAVIKGDTDKGAAEYPLDDVSLYCIAKSGKWRFHAVEYKSSEWFTTGDPQSIIAFAVGREQWEQWIKKAIATIERGCGKSKEQQFQDYIDAAFLSFSQNQDFKTAIAFYDKAIALRPDYGNAYNNRGCLYIHIGEVDRGIKDLGKVIALNPNDAMAYANRGIAYGKKGEQEKSTADLDKARSLDPKVNTSSINLRISDVSPVIEFKLVDGEIMKK